MQALYVSDALQAIKEVLERNDRESEKLWWILTALRGPDSENYDDKKATTSIIRTKAFGYLDHTLAEFSPEDCESDLKTRIALANEGPNQHFTFHVKEAFIALNLSWNSINDLKEEK